MNKREILLRVEAPNFCAGAVFRRGGNNETVCVETAPILRRFLLGKTLEEAKGILHRKKELGWRSFGLDEIKAIGAEIGY